MTVYQFCIIILAGFPAIICLAYLLYLLFIWFEDSSEKKWLKQIENSSYCYMCGDYVDSKKCDEHCDYCKYNNSNLHKRKLKNDDAAARIRINLRSS